MKKRILYLFLVVLLLGLIGCSGETTTVETTTVTPTTETPITETVSENEIIIVLGEESHTLGYDDHSMSVLELIEASDIHLVYTTSEYGAMVTEIGDYKADTFHWIGFTKNDEFAMEGLEQIAYEDGDVFEFTENFSNWEMTIEVTYDSSDDTHAYFTLADYQVKILSSEVSEVLIVGESYSVTATPQSINNQEVLLATTSIEPSSYEGYINIRMDENDNYIAYDDLDSSVLELIEASDIHLVYTTSEYGAMVTEIGDYKADTFHWIGFTKNDEFATEGLGQIAYEDGDVFEFTENFSNWEMTIEVTYDSSDDTYAYFLIGDYQVNVLLSEITDVLFKNETYSITMTPQSINEQEVLVTLSTIEPLSYVVINDFTELYSIELNDVFFLEFTVTSYEGSSAFGYELFADDVNGLSSTDIFPNMPYPSQSDYVFYTIPDGYTLELGKTYIGRFIYQVNDPSTIAQITLYEDGLDTAIKEK
jgi:hypothetical protein